MSGAGPSNVAVLTHEKKIWLAKKRQKKEQVKEIIFDEDNRREFLTGFRKRKLARQEAGKAKAREKEHQSRLEARRERRKDLAERAAQNVKDIERVYAGDSGSDSDADSRGSSQARQQEEELQFQNEEQFATVTVVEDFDADDVKDLSLGRTNGRDGEMGIEQSELQTTSKKSKERPSAPTVKATNSKSRPNKKFRYETKTARKHDKIKQRQRKEAKRKQGSMKKAK